ncbi:MAG: hypothetical protein AAB347_01130, partial [Bacteroidota bacterium]
VTHTSPHPTEQLATVIATARNEREAICRPSTPHDTVTVAEGPSAKHNPVPERSRRAEGQKNLIPDPKFEINP